MLVPRDQAYEVEYGCDVGLAHEESGSSTRTRLVLDVGQEGADTVSLDSVTCVYSARRSTRAAGSARIACTDALVREPPVEAETTEGGILSVTIAGATAFIECGPGLGSPIPYD